MGIARVVDLGIDLARRNYRYLVGVSVWGLLPAAVAYAFANALVASAQRPSPTLIVLIGAGFLAYGFFQVLTGNAVTLACARLINPTGEPNELTAGELYWVATTRLGYQILLGLLLMVTLGPLFVLLPLGVWIGVRWSVAWIALIVEGTGPIRSLGRSWELSRHAWWHTLAVVLADVIITGVLSSMVGGIGGAVAGGLGFIAGNPVVAAALTALLSIAATIVVEPFAVPILVVLYYELRARGEGFDLQQRASLFPQQP